MIKCFDFGAAEGKKKGRAAPSRQRSTRITALNYGPYDNGHIILGLSNGYILILNSLDLSSMFRFRAFDTSFIQKNPQPNSTSEETEQPIAKILFDPTQMILAASLSSPRTSTLDPSITARASGPFCELNLAGITLIENVTQYKYIEMGQNTYMTLQIANQMNQAKKRREQSPMDNLGGNSASSWRILC